MKHGCHWRAQPDPSTRAVRTVRMGPWRKSGVVLDSYGEGANGKEVPLDIVSVVNWASEIMGAKKSQFRRVKTRKTKHPLQGAWP